MGALPIPRITLHLSENLHKFKPGNGFNAQNRESEDITSLLSHLGKPKTLLKLLLVHPGRTFTQDKLVEWLWRELSPALATANLRKRISELRQALEPWLQRGSDSHYILTRESGYAFNPRAQYTTDTHVFYKDGNQVKSESDPDRSTKRSKNTKPPLT
jgi:DNA-binding SARP family transcriptional activator